MTDREQIENCPLCGSECADDWAGVDINHVHWVECDACPYRIKNCDTLAEAISAHNELCRRKPVQNLPRAVMVRTRGSVWRRSRLVAILEDSAYPYVAVSDDLPEPRCWPYMREIPAAPKRVPLEFDDYRENRDMWLKGKRNGDDFRITGLLSKSKKILVGVTYYDCEGLHTEFTHTDGTPLEKDAE